MRHRTSSEAVKLAARVRRPGFVVPLKVDVSRPKVDRLVASLGKRFHRDPVDATLKLRNLKPFATKDVPGRRLKELIAARAIVLALKTQTREPLDAAVRADRRRGDERRARPRDRDPAGHEPALLYQVAQQAEADPRRSRSRPGAPSTRRRSGSSRSSTSSSTRGGIRRPDPTWAKDAKPIPPGPGNPLGTRWMGLSAPYVGIHGTPDAASIGYSASHGCIRMLIPQVEWLFTQVDVGTPVFIVAA